MKQGLPHFFVYKSSHKFHHKQAQALARSPFYIFALFQKGDKLVINKGVFQGKEANFLSTTGKERVRILLKLMNELIITEVPGHDVGRKAIIETFKL